MFSKLISKSYAISGGDLLVGERIDGGDGSLEGTWMIEGLLRYGVMPATL